MKERLGMCAGVGKVQWSVLQVFTSTYRYALTTTVVFAFKYAPPPVSFFRGNRGLLPAEKNAVFVCYW